MKKFGVLFAAAMVALLSLISCVTASHGSDVDLGQKIAASQNGALPEQTVAFDDLESAYVSKTIGDYVGKDLTVTGIHYLMATEATPLQGATLDGKNSTDVFRALKVVDRMQTLDQLEFLFPDKLLRQFSVLGQPVLDRIEVAHVRVAKVVVSGWFLVGWAETSYVLVPLDNVQVIDTKAAAQ